MGEGLQGAGHGADRGVATLLREDHDRQPLRPSPRHLQSERSGPAERLLGSSPARSGLATGSGAPAAGRGSGGQDHEPGRRSPVAWLVAPFRRLTVRGKLFASYGLLVVLVVVMVGFGVAVASTARSNGRAAQANVAETTAVKQLQLDGASVAVAENSVAFDYSSHGSATGDLQSFSQGSAAFRADSKAVAALGLTPAERANLTAADRAFSAYTSLSSKINRDFATNTKASLAAAATGVAALAFSTVTTPLGHLVSQVAAEVASHTTASISGADNAQGLVLGFGVLAVLLAVLSAAAITRCITRPIREINETLSAVTAGDLGSRAAIITSDELGEVAGSLNRAIAAQAAARDEVDAQGEAQAAASADNAAAIEVLGALHGATNTEEAVTRALDSIRLHFGWSYGAFWEVDGEGRELHLAAQTGGLGSGELDRSDRSSALAAGTGLVGRALATRELVYSDTAAPLEHCPRVACALRSGAEVAVAFPVLVGGRAIGTMDFFGEGRNGELAPWRLTAMRNVAQIVSQGLEGIQAQSREREAERELQGKVEAILAVVSAAAEGDLTVQVPVSGSDAIGQVGAGLTTLLADLRNRMGTIGETAQGLAAASEELLVTSSELSSGSEATSSSAQSASTSADLVSSQVGSVSVAAEELTASIREIAKNSADAARVAVEATAVAEETNATVSKLGESSGEIGKVIKVITSIAQQTNLLALNATIEAARAGEAGKGFAVVAGEVKDLARETATATDDISSKIAAIQADTASAVEAIGKIKEIIDRINELQSAIASAVEEQTATTNEIARSVSGAAKGADEITSTIGEVAHVAQQGSVAAQGAAGAVGGLARMTSGLQQLVARFRY